MSLSRLGALGGGELFCDQWIELQRPAADRLVADLDPTFGEQFVTKPKLVKRQMYGRGKLDLLQVRVIAAGV